MSRCCSIGAGMESLCGREEWKGHTANRRRFPSVVEGSSLVFPEISGSGTYPVVGGTTLRVSSSSSDWAVSHSVAFEIPPGASEEVVTRILEVVYDAHSPKSGATDIGVSYALAVEEADFAGLPEGEYVIHITFTAAEN